MTSVSCGGSRWLAVITALTFGAGMARAAAPDNEQTAEALIDLPLEQLVRIEIPSVVGASKYKQKANEAPSSITVITADEIKKYGYLTLADVLRSVRGFYVGNDRNYNFLGVRGFSLPGDYNSRTLVLIDGHRINDSVYQSGSIEGVFPLDLDLVDRVEIIRGPGSSLYGSSAFFAVINVIPKRGEDFQGAEISGGVGSYQAQRERATFGKKFGNGVDFLFSASAYSNEGNKHLVFPELANDASKNNGILDKADGERWKDLYASLKYGDFTFEAVLGSRRKTFGTGIYDGTVFNDPGNFSVDAHQYVDLQYSHALGDESSIFARVYLDRYDYWLDGLYDRPPVVVNKDSADGEWWGGEVKYVTRLARKHRLTLGGEYIDYTQADQKNYDADPQFGCLSATPPTAAACMNSKQAFKTSALYVQDEVSITDKLILSVGVRHDDLYRGVTSTNPRLGLIYNPTQSTTLKALYGTAFRAPSAYERYFNVLGFKDNPNLRPEKIKTAELAIEQGFGKNLRGIASIYEYRLNNLIGIVTDPADGLNVFQNLEKIKATGLELELNAKWAWLEGRVSYTYQDVARQDTGESLPNSPKHLGKLNLIVPVLGDKLWAGFESQYVSRRNNIRGDPVPGYSLANVTLLNRNWIRRLELSAGVYNLFDKRYGDPASADDDPALTSVPQDGRSYRVKLTYKF